MYVQSQVVAQLMNIWKPYYIIFGINTEGHSLSLFRQDSQVEELSGCGSPLLDTLEKNILLEVILY